MPHPMPQGAANHTGAQGGPAGGDRFADSLLASLQSVPSHQSAAWTLTSDTHFRVAVLGCSMVLAVMLVLRLLYLRKRAREGRIYHRLETEVGGAGGAESAKDRELLLQQASRALDLLDEEDFYEPALIGMDVPLLHPEDLRSPPPDVLKQFCEMEPRPQFLLRKPMQITRI